jgi:hypothetical protein
METQRATHVPKRFIRIPFPGSFGTFYHYRPRIEPLEHRVRPEIGDVEKDEEGVATMRTLGRNMARLLKRLNGGEG